MKISNVFKLLAVTIALVSLPARAQLNAKGPVVNGHYHLNVSDVAAQQRFWVDTLGGKPGTFNGSTPIVMFPDALVFMREQAPTGGSIGTTVDHIGFSVPDLRKVVDRLTAAGYEMVTAAQSPPGSQVVDDIRIVPGNGPVTGVAYVIGPDDVKVEVLEMRAQSAPIVSHHVHFFGDEADEMRAWYVDVFGAAAQQGGGNGFVVASLPGLNMNFTDTAEATAATPGRAIDHIGFEVDDLEAFIGRLQAKGIKLDVPYREIPGTGLAIAFISDPWGTSIELTQGLDELR
jgi:catechol 2,3-dioxygenase-like lactoylglutathione lyase family enzyme